MCANISRGIINNLSGNKTVRQ